MTQLKKRIVLLIEYASESTTACLVMMVQGNMLALTASHLLIASQTGIIAGSVASVAILAARTRTRWIISVMLGVATAVVDFFVHPGMFGPVFMEALLTGVGAALLSYLVGIAVQSLREKRMAKTATDRDAQG